MNVCDIMTAKPACIQQNNTLRQALELMEKIGCHHLPVLNGEKHVVGIISDRDCRRALNSPEIDLEQVQNGDIAQRILVRSLMTPAPIITEPNTPAHEAARLMLVNRIGCLPVMRSETLVGILTKSDILLAFIRMSKNPIPAGELYR